MLVKEFGDEEPLSISYNKQFPAPIEVTYQKWREFWGPWMDDAVTNHLSVGIFDTHKDNQMVAVSISKDLSYAPPNAEEYTNRMMADKDFRTGIFVIEDLLKNSVVDPELKKALTTEAAKTIDIWGVAIDKAYTGRKLLFKMMKINEDMARAKGITKGFCYAVNYKTTRALVKIDYKLAAEVDSSKVDVGDGVVPFKLIEDPHRLPSIWMKDL